jgi:hypothetical protein
MLARRLEEVLTALSFTEISAVFAGTISLTLKYSSTRNLYV